MRNTDRYCSPYPLSYLVEGEGAQLLQRLKLDAGDRIFDARDGSIKQFSQAFDFENEWHEWTLPKKFLIGEKAESISPRVLTLNFSEACDLRCTYCYYDANFKHSRNHGRKNMPSAIWKSAISQFSQSDNCEQKAIYFFGGEPSLNPELVNALTYARNMCPNSIIQVVTNGTKISDDLLSCLIENDIYLNISYDGINHDRNRPTKGGRKSQSSVESTIDKIHSMNLGYFRSKVGISAVLSRPFPEIREFVDYFMKQNWIGDVAYVDTDIQLSSNVALSKEQEINFKLQLWSELASCFLDTSSQRRKIIYGFNAVHRPLWRAFWHGLCRQSADPELPRMMGAEGLPHEVLLLVRADGTLNAHYEFQNQQNEIGNLFTGIDCLASTRIFDAHYQFMQNNCAKCWAAPMCGIDYNELDPVRQEYDEAGFQKHAKNRCESERLDVTLALEFLYNIIEDEGLEPVMEIMSFERQQSEEVMQVGS